MQSGYLSLTSRYCRMSGVSAESGTAPAISAGISDRSLLGDLFHALDQIAVTQERVDAEVALEHTRAGVLAQPERQLAIGEHAAHRLGERAEVERVLDQEAACA